ncbi:MAG TPA: YHS domain-containing (seleno)protein [Flavobacteriaceae bacterium]|nr:YHS domain-containing (seleno)protein [Flavobacteriaceae bacterium]
MKNLLFFLFVGFHVGFAQSIDYNTKKGYVAEGFDVVAYFDHKAVEGNKEYTTTYDGVKYKFISQEHLDAFQQHPEKYIPQYGGYCAYAMGESGKKVNINPETFEIRDGKLYLFYNAWGTNTFELWLKDDVKGLQEKADQNWEAVKHK